MLDSLKVTVATLGVILVVAWVLATFTTGGSLNEASEFVLNLFQGAWNNVTANAVVSPLEGR